MVTGMETAQLHHRVEGPAGAPVLLMGGSLGTTLEMWSHQQALAERLRLIPFDLRGHGSSPEPPGPYTIGELASDVVGVLDWLGIERASYCGISLGGMIGMALAAYVPERIDRLVLICTSAHLPPASAWAARAETVRAAGSTQPIADAVVGRWLTPAFADAHPSERERLRTMLVGSPPEGYASCCTAIEQMDLRPELNLIRAPTLVISGAQDEATPREHQQTIASEIPGARLESVDAAHIAAVEQAGDVNRLILDHLEAR